MTDQTSFASFIHKLSVVNIEQQPCDLFQRNSIHNSLYKLGASLMQFETLTSILPHLRLTTHSMYLSASRERRLEGVGMGSGETGTSRWILRGGRREGRDGSWGNRLGREAWQVLCKALLLVTVLGWLSWLQHISRNHIQTTYNDFVQKLKVLLC